MDITALSPQDYAERLAATARAGATAWRPVLETWREAGGFSELWGYNPPAGPMRLAAVLAWLRAQGYAGPEASREALAIVRAYADLRDGVRAEKVAARAETRERGLPLFVDFFLIAPYAGLVRDLRAAGDAGPSDLTFLETELARLMDLLFAFPEWGGHNRSVIRADAADLAARVLPDAPGAGAWMAMADALAADSVDHWEIEDASTYHPVWLYYLLRLQERRGAVAGLRSPFLRWYVEYFLQLIAPHGAVADFGDGEWRSTWLPYVPCFELAARETGDPRYRWAAARIYRANEHLLEATTPAALPPVPWELADAVRWCPAHGATARPDDLSREVLDDAIGKKVVFRTGWEPDSTYLLLGYQDEGSWGALDRQYLRDTLTVEEEKMHHGHADENGVAMLMAGGSLLLHDAGYRDGLSSGRWGAFRADYFHNRLAVRPYRLDAGQDLFELLRSRGAYREVRTTRIDFQRLARADYARTRLVDRRLGWMWDRVVVHLRERGLFAVIDGFAALRDDCYTVACLWHAQRVIARGEGWFAGGYEAMTLTASAGSPLERLNGSTRLLVQRVGEVPGRISGSFPLRRHYQDETACYEAESRHFLAGRWTAFVTLLVPIADAEARRDGGPALQDASIVPTSWGEAALCLRLGGPVEDWLLVKLDLERERRSEDVRPRTDGEAAMVSAGPIATDAHFAHVRTAGGRPRWSLTVASRLAWNGEPLFEAPRNTFGLQPDGGADRESRARWRRWEG